MKILEQVARDVRNLLAGAEGGHDWWHTYRVWQNALELAKTEEVDVLTIELASLLHDVADAKFHQGDESKGPQLAGKIMDQYPIDDATKSAVLEIIRNISFKNSFDREQRPNPELNIVQDADQLEALGAIGIARAFSYGGYINQPIFDPELPAKRFTSKKEYKNARSTSINHFYEKLLTLKDRMNTARGRELAETRSQYMVSFLEQFYTEIGHVPGWHHSR